MARWNRQELGYQIPIFSDYTNDLCVTEREKERKRDRKRERERKSAHVYISSIFFRFCPRFILEAKHFYTRVLENVRFCVLFGLINSEMSAYK